MFDDRPVPAALAGLPTRRADDLETALGSYRRLVVFGGDADLATVLTRLLRADRLDIEVGYAPPRRTRATRVYRLPAWDGPSAGRWRCPIHWLCGGWIWRSWPRRRSGLAGNRPSRGCR
ncbi:hypothetical protein AAHI00_03575, partial [Mycobacterium kansasii]